MFVFAFWRAGLLCLVLVWFGGARGSGVERRGPGLRERSAEGGSRGRNGGSLGASKIFARSKRDPNTLVLTHTPSSVV